MSLRGRFGVWLAAVTALVAAYGFGVAGHLQVETDLLAMLPRVERDPLVEDAVRALSATTGKRTLFLVGAPDEPQARAAAEDLAGALKASGVFEPVTLQLSLDTGALDALYGTRRSVLLSDRHRQLLANDQAGQLTLEAQRALYTPSGWLRARPFAQDPLNLYGDFLAQQLPLAGKLRLSKDVLIAPSDRGPYVFLSAESQADPFSLKDNARVEGVIADAIAGVTQRHPGSDIVTSGVVRHAAAASARGQAELTTFGSISTLAIVLLIVLVFRSARPLLLTLLSLGVGALAALTVTALLFERVHLITLVFGSTLTGVGVDYSIHYFADQFRYEGRWDAKDTLHHVGPAIGIGMLATVLGYFALLLLPFPGLRQMALFSIVGIVASCATVLAAHPVLANRVPASHRPRALEFARWLGDLPSRLGRLGRLGRARRMGLVERGPTLGFATLSPAYLLSPAFLIALLVLACAFGIWRVSFVDDIRALQSTPDWLKAQESRARELLGGGFDTRFFLVEAPTAEGVLVAEEELRASLDALVARGALGGYQAVSRGLPSQARQQQNRRWLEEEILPAGGALAKLLGAIGYAPAAIAQQRAAFGAPPRFLAPEDWLASPVSAPLRSLWLAPVSARLGRGYATAVSLSGVNDLPALQALADRLPAVSFVDRVARVSELLRRFRQLASLGLLAAFAVIGAALMFRYGPAIGARLMIAPVGGAALTLATLGYLGVTANLFNVLALLLVLGMGVDYAVFMREGRTARTTVIMAILLAGLMTLLSFGLLALSSTPFIRSLGLTVTLGVSYTFVLALVTARGENAAPATPSGTP